jgi:phosphoribosylformylglycinamidine synthase
MGAAGLTSSSAEMAARGDVGVVIDVQKVPVRETGMTPYEILLSESQERMLVVAKRGQEHHVREILARWDLQAEVIGEVIDEPVYRVKEGDRVVAEFPGSRLVTDCPTYSPPAIESETVVALRQRDVASIPELPEEKDPAWTLLRLLASPNIASKRWVYEQYDTTVRTNTVLGPGGDAAVIRIRGTNKALAMKTDCNGRYVYLDPRVGGRIAVAEAARNVACTGARPLAITNCLNFGNPRRPEVFFQFAEAVTGMGEACRELGTPVTGGNVSFYNESPSGAVFPTPMIGMVGLIDDISHITPSSFRRAGDSIVLLGLPTEEIGASEYLSCIHGITAGRPPVCDPALERRTIDLLLECIAAGLVQSAHDCSEGGIAVTLAECAMMSRERQFGVEVNLSSFSGVTQRALLFGEAQARFVVSTADAAALLERASRTAVPASLIGTVGQPGGVFEVRTASGTIARGIAELAEVYHGAIPRIMSRPAATLAHTGGEMAASLEN